MQAPVEQEKIKGGFVKERMKIGVRRLAALVGLTLLAAGSASAQSNAAIAGRVTGEDGNPLPSAQVVVINLSTGAQTGTLADGQGQYRVSDLRANTPYRVDVVLLGYGRERVEEVRLGAGETRQLNFTLGSEAISVDAIEVFSERAIERRTPVAYTDIDKVQVERQLASRDLPLVLNTTPSVYATAQGGGAGDARVNVRGFTQRNIGVMINGVPVNDMENGWVYWSNWDGVGDATSSIQLQRGLSAVNLATPSIGGTLNVITDAAAIPRRVSVKQEFGNDGFLKTTGMVATGLINDRFALALSGVRKTGDGLVQGTWTDAWAYYLASTFVINPKNRIDFFALGAPQKHGQSSFKQNIAAYSHEFARDLDDYDPAALDRYPEAPNGREFNQNFNTVSVDYDGKQYFAGDIDDRYSSGFLNERVNHFHKPQVNLNWYSQLTDDLLWSTVAYYSGGTGGGSGTFGSMRYETAGLPSRIVDWDATIVRNRDNVDAQGRSRSFGILRSSRNNQWTIGAISKLKKEFSPALTVEVGADWRTAEIEHYRDVVDLLGGDYFQCTGSCASDFWTGTQNELGLGDILDYNNTNDVDWLGGYAQAEYAVDKFSSYGMLGLSSIKYGLVDHFKRCTAEANASQSCGTVGGPVTLTSDQIPGFQVKGGGLVNLTESLGVFANAGYVAKVPIFDDVISDINTIMNEDPKNEKFLSLEAGMTYRGQTMPVTVKSNVYYTTWRDRAQTRRFFDEAGEDYFVTMTGLDQRHAGIEVEAAYQPSSFIRFDAAGSLGAWEYTDDVDGSFRPEGSSEATEYRFYIDGLKVGDAPQRQVSYGATIFPIDELYVQAVGKTYSNHYADFNPFDRDDPDDRAQSWKTPGYTVVDLHAGYNLQLPTMGRVRLFANVLNLFDKLYIQDALDNSSFSGFDADHDADDAEVFIGLPRSFVLGVQVSR